MITLLPATQEAFNQRKLKLHPVLTVIDEAGVETTVSPSQIITRPARTHSPLLTRSPVMRLDLDIVPSQAMLDLFKEQRRVKYVEIVNGQPIDKFSGHVWALDKGWAVKDGAVVASLKVTAYSESQRLKDADCELHHTHVTKQPPLGRGLVLSPVLTTVYVHAKRQASGNDPIQDINCAWAPHTAGATAARIAWAADNGDVTERLGNADFSIVKNGTTGTLEVAWTSGAPASGTAYQLRVTTPIAFVVRFTEGAPVTYFDDQTTPQVMEPYTLASDQFTVESIPESDLAYCRYFTPSQSVPSVRIRQTGDGGAPVIANMADWEWTLERGYARYVGKGAIFDVAQIKGGEVQFVGVKGLYWPDPVSKLNTPEHLMTLLYDQAGGLGVAPSAYTGFDASGIVAAEFDAAEKGEKVLTTVFNALPPNYLVYDGEDGKPRGRYMVQLAQAQLKLATVTGLKDKEPPEMFTRLVVRSILENQPADTLELYDSFEQAAQVAGAFVIDDDAVFAKPGVNQTWFRVVYPFDHDTRFRSLKLRFEGELRVKVAPADASLAAPDHTRARGVPGFQAVQTDGIKEVTVANVAELLSPEALVPSYLVLELHPTSAVASPKLYELDLVVDHVINRRAWLTDLEGAEGVWIEVGIGWRKRVDTDFLKRWLVNEARSSDPTTFDREWWKHRNKVLEVPGIDGDRAKVLSRAHMDDVLRRATAQEIDVVYEPMAQIGDTIELYDPTTRQTLRRLVIGYREGTSWEEPTTTIEVADYT